jgi:dTDP-4-amino-4,6-dideoxygalactose transaminase
VVRTRRRDELRQELTRRGIGTGIHYTHAVHTQKSFGFLGYKPGDFPVSEAWARGVLSLPLYPQLEEEQVRFIGAQIREIL